MLANIKRHKKPSSFNKVEIVTSMSESQEWHTENTLLGSRMEWRMESTRGLVLSKALSSI